MTHILLTNDDGIEAPGLWALVQALKSSARLTIFAPDHNWSAAGHTKTMHKPLRVRPMGTWVRPVGTRVRPMGTWARPYSFSCPMPSSSACPSSTPDETWGDRIQAYATTGTPSDCVALALLGILSQKPDLVVSGINQGANFGHDLTYSGTVAAAIEAVIFGLPAVAVSLDTADEPYPAEERKPEVGAAPRSRPPDHRHDFDFAAQMAVRVIRQVEERGLPPGTFLNVNIPGRPPDETDPRAPSVPSIVITRLGRRVYRDVLIERQDPRGRPYYWIGGEPPSGHLDEGTDIWAVANGYVSITPVHLDMTAHDLIPTLQDWKFQ